MPEQSAKEKIKEFLSAIITEHNSQLAATYLTKAQAAQIVVEKGGTSSADDGYANDNDVNNMIDDIFG